MKKEGQRDGESEGERDYVLFSLFRWSFQEEVIKNSHLSQNQSEEQTNEQTQIVTASNQTKPNGYMQTINK